MSDKPNNKFTVLISSADSPSQVFAYHIEAETQRCAGIEASRWLYTDEHSGWTEEDMKDDPWSLDNYIFHGCFVGFHQLLEPEVKYSCI